MACNNTLLSITLCIPDIRVYQLMTLMCIICIRISILIHFVYTGKCRIFYSATYWCFFDEMQDTEHHYEKLPLSELHTGMVSRSVLDYMHLICLRVVARLIWQWTTGPVWVPAGLVSDTSCWLIERSYVHANLSHCHLVSEKRPRRFDNYASYCVKWKVVWCCTSELHAWCGL